MTKKIKHRNHKKQKQGFPWMVLVIGAVLLVAAIFLFANRGNGNNDGGGTPAITVDQPSIDYGDVKLDTNLTFAIRVTNTGDGNLRFEELPYIEVVEGC